MKKPFKELLMIFVMLLVFAPLFTEKVMAQNGEAKFIGTVTLDETWEPFTCYGAYRSLVEVQEIINDPEGLLTSGSLVPICYAEQHGLTLGELVECFGLYYYSGPCPFQCCGYCVCSDGGVSDYYVVRVDFVKNLDTNIYYGTIQDAINANETFNGHTIFAREGNYYENIHVNKSISLVGENKHGTVIDGNFTAGPVVSITADDVNVSNFTIRNAGQAISVYYTINVTGSKDCTINNNIITNTEKTNALSGIKLWNSNNCMIANNQIYPYNSYEESGANGIRLFYSYGDTLTNNTISSHTAGIHLTLSEDNTVSSNNLCENWYGIRLQDSIDNTVVANNISNNVRGIYVVSYTGPCINNVFYHNNLVNNTYQATPHTYINIWDSGYPLGGNYWSDYNGTDLYKGPFQNITGSDGVGDTPYIIDENNTDMYPLMNPYPHFWSIADVNNDLKVDIYDVILAVNAYGTTPSDPDWDPRCDIAPPWNKVDIFDLVTIASHYGEEYTP